MYEGGWLLTSANEEIGVLPQSDLDPEPDNAEAPIGDATVQGIHSDYGAVTADGLQRRSRAGDEEANTIPSTPRSGSTSDGRKYMVRGKGNENQKLLLERSSDDKEL